MARRPGAVILMLGAAGLCALLARERGRRSAVYLQDSLGTSAGFAAAGFAAFSVAMAAGRLFGDRLAARLGSSGWTGTAAWWPLGLAPA